MPKDEPWIAYTDMSKKYGRRNILGTTGSPQLNRAFLGDIFYLRAFSKVIVVLSSFSAIKDLLEKRGEYYSDRPSVPIVKMYDLKRFTSQCAATLTIFRVDFEWPIFMIGLSDTWRKERKILDSSLRPGAVMSYRQVMQERTHEFLVRLRANPKDFHNSINL
jgi:cytochrome P450